VRDPKSTKQSRCREIYRGLDGDGDESVSPNELAVGVRALNLGIPPEELERSFGAADTSGDGSLDCDEFVALIVAAVGDEGIALLSQGKGRAKDMQPILEYGDQKYRVYGGAGGGAGSTGVFFPFHQVDPLKIP
jgi:hypothetical protein